ncbi:MAG: nitrile hydratase subunit alpha, partial [Dehalococcoidia bacterium]
LYMPLPAELPAGEQPAPWVELWRRAHVEPDFKARLLAEPEAVLVEQGIAVPAGVPVEVVETSDTQGYIAVPPAPEGLDADAAEDVAGYFSCCGTPSEAVPRKVEGPSYFRPSWDAQGGVVTPWAPMWVAPQGTAAVNRRLS